MDIRLMEYFLAVVREGNISAAAAALHVSQPALSRQMKDLEEELGVELFLRGHRSITLTEEGSVLRRRAEEMVSLLQITEREINQVRNHLSGEVRIGTGESLAFHHLSKIAGRIHRDHPDVRFSITSGDTADLMEQLDNGLLDVALMFSDYDNSRYSEVQLPEEDKFAMLMRKDSPLAEKDVIKLSDLQGIPLIVPRAGRELFETDSRFAGLRIVAVYNLIYNASLLVEDGVGYALGFDNLINITGDSVLTFRPLELNLSHAGVVIWKKYVAFSPAVNLFLEYLGERQPK